MYVSTYTSARRWGRVTHRLPTWERRGIYIMSPTTVFISRGASQRKLPSYMSVWSGACHLSQSTSERGGVPHAAYRRPCHSGSTACQSHVKCGCLNHRREQYMSTINCLLQWGSIASHPSLSTINGGSTTYKAFQSVNQVHPISCAGVCVAGRPTHITCHHQRQRRRNH